MPAEPMTLLPVTGVGEVEPGADLAHLLLDALRWDGLELRDGDILVVTQKVVSKAEGRLVDLAEVEPSPLAESWAATWNKDPRQVEVVLRESTRIARMERGVIVSQTRHGWVCANAGVDASNVSHGRLSLLPEDADVSAERLRLRLYELVGKRVGIVISDTFGRPWREGQVNVAIGASGVEVLRRFQGQHDPYGYELRVTEIATADELAAAAELMMGKVDAVPAVLVRGLDRAVTDTPDRATTLVRAPEKDFFR